MKTKRCGAAAPRCEPRCSLDPQRCGLAAGHRGMHKSRDWKWANLNAGKVLLGMAAAVLALGLQGCVSYPQGPELRACRALAKQQDELMTTAGDTMQKALGRMERQDAALKSLEQDLLDCQKGRRADKAKCAPPIELPEHKDAREEGEPIRSLREVSYRGAAERQADCLVLCPMLRRQVAEVREILGREPARMQRQVLETCLGCPGDL